MTDDTMPARDRLDRRLKGGLFFLGGLVMLDILVVIASLAAD